MDCDREFSLNEHGTGSTAQEAEHELTSPPFVAGVSGSPRRPRECEISRLGKAQVASSKSYKGFLSLEDEGLKTVRYRLLSV